MTIKHDDSELLVKGTGGSSLNIYSKDLDNGKRDMRKLIENRKDYCSTVHTHLDESVNQFHTEYVSLT